MEGEDATPAVEAVIQTLRTRGWYIGDINQVKALVIIHTALSDDSDDHAVADSVESELLNMDLKSIGAKFLPDLNLLRKTSHLQGPKILQISSVRDISVSSIERFSDSRNLRLLRFILTDGHNEITAIEYSHIPSIPNDVVPGAKIRLENKAPVHYGILCLNPKVITLIGGVVQSLYKEWQMNQKYSGFSRSSMRSSQETDSSGPPPFEKLQISEQFREFRQYSQQGKPVGNGVSTSKSSVPTAANGRFPDVQLKDKGKTKSLKERTEKEPRLKEVALCDPVQYQATATMHFQNMGRLNHYPGAQKYRGKDKQEPQVFTPDKKIDYFDSTSKSSVAASVETSGNTQIRQIGAQQNINDLADMVTTAAAVQNIEQRPSNSETRPKQVAELVPVQNQVAAQKLLQKMSTPSQGDHYPRGRRHKGKGKQEELPVFTLDEWERRKAMAKRPLKTDLTDAIYDEDLAWQLQNELDMEDSHVQMGMHDKVADDIRMSMFNYEKDADKVHGMEHGGRGWVKGRGRTRGRGGGRGRGRSH